MIKLGQYFVPCLVRSQIVHRDLLRCVSMSSLLFAGHNKWSKVKNIKIPLDIQKNREFQVVINQINTIIAETKNSDIEKNHKLKRVYERSLEAGFGKAKLLNAIQNATKVRVSQENYKITAAALGVHFVVKTYTTIQEDAIVLNRKLRKFCEKANLKKASLSLSDVSPDDVFEPKVMACITTNSEESIDEDKAFEIGLDAEAEDVEFNEERNEWIFVKSGLQLERMKTLLEKQADVESCETVFVPYMPITLSPENYGKAESLFVELNSFDHVTNVFKNYVDDIS
ncbi:probable transcriptional regulatory protein THEYE_A1868 [Symsagittifera roscoffensis]|uniref:probable transcriptional regulatory protein THEYE_A1868 n=1 Tax=Symsagittifera roscoffensis TaxID=84072 RepID=UPI00307C980E